jgi:hypothetical protein
MNWPMPLCERGICRDGAGLMATAFVAGSRLVLGSVALANSSERGKPFPTEGFLIGLIRLISRLSDAARR